MFSKIAQSSNKVDTILACNFKLKGNLEAENGSIRIDGEFEGDIRIGGDLYVGEKGVVNGSIIAKDVIIAGQVNGKIEAHGKLELTPSAKVLADAKMIFLSIEDGAYYKGLCEPQTQEEFKKSSTIAVSDTKNLK